MMLNVRRGIDNGAWEVQPNDLGDADEGPNRMQNSPVFTGFFQVTDGVTRVGFQVDSQSGNSQYPLQIELF